MIVAAVLVVVALAIGISRLIAREVRLYQRTWRR